jgi:hypothetical protein
MTTYIHFDGKQTGPHTEEELNRLWLAGEIRLHASYWRPGMSEWKPIGELFDIPSPPSLPRPRERGADGGSGRPQRVWYHDRNDTFHGTLQQVMRLAVRAIQDLGYKVDSANESVGIITFQTGITWGSWSGAICSLTFVEEREDVFRVKGAGKQNISGAQLLAIDFGEAKGKAEKVINRMAEMAD